MTDTCNPWIIEPREGSNWSYPDATVWRVAENRSFRRITEQNTIRITGRRAVAAWTAQAGSFTGWNVVGYNVRRTENACERLTEAGDPRIVE